VLQQQSKRETRADGDDDDDDDNNNKPDKPQSTREREERERREREERRRGQCTLHSVSGTSTKGKQNVMSSVTQHLERPIIGTQNVMSGVVSDSRLERPLNGSTERHVGGPEAGGGGDYTLIPTRHLEPSYSWNLSAVDSTIFRRGGSVPPCQLPFQYWSLS